MLLFASQFICFYIYKIDHVDSVECRSVITIGQGVNQKSFPVSFVIMYMKQSKSLTSAQKENNNLV